MNMLGSLRKEIVRFARDPENLTGARKNLSRYEKRNELFGDFPKINVTLHQKVFMAPVGIPQGIRVIFENIDVAGEPFFSEALFGYGQTGFEDSLSSFFMHHQLENIIALGSGILGVTAGILIKSGPIREEGIGRPTIRNQSFKNIAQDFFNGQIHPTIG